MLRHIFYPVLLSIGLTPTLAISATYDMPSTGNDIIGENYYVKAQPGDTLASLGLRYGMSYHEMMEANPRINANNMMRGGQKVLIPSQFILPPYRKGIVINLAELRMYYFPPNGKYVMTFPVAMGIDQWRTPTTITSVVMKEPNPVWNVPETIRQFHLEHTGELLPESVPPGPKNPLGKYALHLGKMGYLIHGNNAPSSIDKYVSSGCIRMNNADIETLYNLVSVGTPVYIIHYPNKIGWYNGVLYQESQVPVEIPDEPSSLNQTSLTDSVERGIKNKSTFINWKNAESVQRQHLGVPQPIGEKNVNHADDQDLSTPISLADEPTHLATYDIPSHIEDSETSIDQASWLPPEKDF